MAPPVPPVPPPLELVAAAATGTAIFRVEPKSSLFPDPSVQLTL